MKLTDIALLGLSLVVPALTGCTSKDDNSLGIAPAASVPAVQTPPVVQKRTLVAGAQLSTSAANLILDPGFGLIGTDTGNGAFITVVAATYAAFTMTTTLDSRSPAGFGGAVGIAMSDGATNKASDSLLILTSFPGGDGPFKSQIWVSKNDIDGNPIDFTADAKSIMVAVTDGSPDGTAYNLTEDTAARRKVGARTWVRLHLDLAKPLIYGGFFVVTTGEDGGQWELAAPEVTAQPLVDALAVRSLDLGSGSAPVAVGRPKTSAEALAIAKYRSIKPKMVPASSRPVTEALLGH